MHTSLTENEFVRVDGRRRPRVLGIGGSTRPHSSSEQALKVALDTAEDHGAEVELFAGRRLMLPIYDTETRDRSRDAIALLDAVRSADALVVCTPSYHGAVSGMIKNVLDYFEDLASDDRPYLHGMAVGCITVAYGWQATASALAGLRTSVHALRGWPTPLGATINASITRFGPSESQLDDQARFQLRTVGEQVTDFAESHVASFALAGSPDRSSAPLTGRKTHR